MEWEWPALRLIRERLAGQFTVVRHDGRELFATIRTPTLVIHCREDRIVPFDEGRLLASVMPGARFHPLPTMTHYFPGDDEISRRMTDAIVRFSAAGDGADGPAPPGEPAS